MNLSDTDNMKNVDRELGKSLEGLKTDERKELIRDSFAKKGVTMSTSNQKEFLDRVSSVDFDNMTIEEVRVLKEYISSRIDSKDGKEK